MNKADLIDAVSTQAGLQGGRDARRRCVFDCDHAALKTGDTVTLVGFGTFVVKARGARRPQPAHRRDDPDSGRKCPASRLARP